jgi:hypothetical protein
MNVKPGQTVKIVIREDMLRERIEVRNSITYDVQDKTVILAQTDPPVLPSYMGRRVVITYLRKEKGSLVRYGFFAHITEMIKDYRLNSGQTQAVILVSQDSKVEPYNLRMHFRVEPPTDSGLGLRMGSEDVHLLDVSVGGAKFSHMKTRSSRVGQMLKITLIIDDTETELSARILRIWDESDRNLEFLSVQFPYIEQKIADSLARKIVDVERRLRFREVFG